MSDAQDHEAELSENELQWLRDCKATGFDPVEDIQKLRSELMTANHELATVKQKNEDLLTGWVPPAHWPEAAWDVLLDRHFTDRVEVGDQWVLFKRPGEEPDAPQS